MYHKEWNGSEYKFYNQQQDPCDNGDLEFDATVWGSSFGFYHDSFCVAYHIIRIISMLGTVTGAKDHFINLSIWVKKENRTCKAFSSVLKYKKQ